MRLAWFTPWPPQPSGIAGRSVEVTNLLAGRGAGIDICVDNHFVKALTPTADAPVDAGVVRVQSAHDFVWRNQRDRYDLVVYQIGNSKDHDFMWPYVFQWPGLVVLHDARLHHARARRLQKPGGQDAFRAEFAFDHPDVSPDVAELSVAGFDGRYFSTWPMTRAIVESAKLVAVHTRGGQAEIAAAHPTQAVRYLPLGMGRRAEVPGANRERMRRAFGATDNAVVFGVFGGLTADKRIPEIIRAVADVRRRHGNVRLWLAGRPDTSTDDAALVRASGAAEAVISLGRLDDAAFEDAIAATDVCLNLRWPTAVETSGPWLQALSMARPTVIIELAHQAHVPALDPRDWRPRNPADARPPVTVAVDILDEHHSLVLAIDRLATDAALRDRLGRAAREYWLAEHTADRMADGYEALVDEALKRPAPPVALPPHLRPDVWRETREVAARFGITQCELR